MKKTSAWILVGMLLLGGALGTCACKKNDSKEDTKIEKTKKSKNDDSDPGDPDDKGKNPFDAFFVAQKRARQIGKQEDDCNQSKNVFPDDPPIENRHIEQIKKPNEER